MPSKTLCLFILVAAGIGHALAKTCTKEMRYTYMMWKMDRFTQQLKPMPQALLRISIVCCPGYQQIGQGRIPLCQPTMTPTTTTTMSTKPPTTTTTIPTTTPTTRTTTTTTKMPATRPTTTTTTSTTTPTTTTTIPTTTSTTTTTTTTKMPATIPTTTTTMSTTTPTTTTTIPTTTSTTTTTTTTKMPATRPTTTTTTSTTTTRIPTTPTTTTIPPRTPTSTTTTPATTTTFRTTARSTRTTTIPVDERSVIRLISRMQELQTKAAILSETSEHNPMSFEPKIESVPGAEYMKNLECEGNVNCACPGGYTLDSQVFKCRPLCNGKIYGCIGGTCIGINQCRCDEGTHLVGSELFHCEAVHSYWKWALLLLLIPAGLIVVSLAIAIHRCRTARANRIKARGESFPEVRFNTSTYHGDDEVSLAECSTNQQTSRYEKI